MPPLSLFANSTLDSHEFNYCEEEACFFPKICVNMQFPGEASNLRGIWVGDGSAFPSGMGLYLCYSNLGDNSFVNCMTAIAGSSAHMLDPEGKEIEMAFQWSCTGGDGK